MAAAGRPRVSSTIKPRCDAARSPHPAHIHLHLPAHSRSSDLRQYQVSSKTISARARGDARVAASGRVSGVRRPSSFGPGYPGSPPSDWAGSARTIVDAEDDAASFPSWTSPVARFAASERVYILGMPAHTALSGGNGRPGKNQINPPFSSLFQLTHQFPTSNLDDRNNTKLKHDAFPPERLHRSLPHLPRRSRRHGRGRRLRSLHDGHGHGGGGGEDGRALRRREALRLAGFRRVRHRAPLSARW